MEPKLKDGIKQLRTALAAADGRGLRMFIGLDGFVDEIIHVVHKRHDFESFDRMETIGELGERISRAAGLSANIELVTVNAKLGGNGPIFANALIEYGVDVTYCGALGKPEVHPVFLPMTSRCRYIPITEPGHTDALEFLDGKLMLGKIESMNNIRWDSFRDALGGREGVAAMISASDLFGMENWTMLPYMNEIWENLISEVFPLLEDRAVPPIAFFDLADPEKRAKKDIQRAMELISQFEGKFRAVLGLNEKEVYEIAEVFGLPSKGGLQAVMESLYPCLGIHCLVVHPTKEAAACTKEGFFHTFGPYCQKPVLTTGAGDNFNAGFCYGLSLGLDTQVALMAGVSTSGYYVRNAKSPTLEDLKGFLERWELDGTI